jgi:hypothetical protein
MTLFIVLRTVGMSRKRGSCSCFSGLASVEGVTSAITGKIGDNFKNNISLMLGGKQTFVLNVVLDFAEASGRFRSRVPGGLTSDWPSTLVSKVYK